MNSDRRPAKHDDDRLQVRPHHQDAWSSAAGSDRQVLVNEQLRTRTADRAGLTLLELMVVLIILAIVATVAMRAMEPQINSQRLQSASRLLDEIRVATIGQTEKYQLDGTPLMQGFVSDLGCLPRVSPEATEADASQVLAELWSDQSSLALTFPFEYRNGPQRPVDYSSIRIPCGWRGPYLHLAAGGNGIVDPWGQKLRLIADADGQVSDVVIDIPESAAIKDQPTMATSLASGKVDVTGTVLLDDTDQGKVVAALLTPDPQTSLTTLAAIADEDKERAALMFRNIPIGFRAVVVDVGDRRQVKYIQVSHRGANVVFDFRQTNLKQ